VPSTRTTITKNPSKLTNLDQIILNIKNNAFVSVIKGNFNVKKIVNDTKDKEQKELEALIERAGVGSHMIFRSENKDDELFVDEL
jgi:hypothetical protein